MWWINAHEEPPQEGAVVLVAGGVAQYRDGIWYTGMEEPLYQRPIEWDVKWWMAIPSAPEAA